MKGMLAGNCRKRMDGNGPPLGRELEKRPEEARTNLRGLLALPPRGVATCHAATGTSIPIKLKG